MYRDIENTTIKEECSGIYYRIYYNIKLYFIIQCENRIVSDKPYPDKLLICFLFDVSGRLKNMI